MRTRLLIWLAVAAFTLQSNAQCLVEDIFGRTLNTRGITLVDWDGYMANPLITFYVYPPTNAVLPGNATLSANGERLYFNNTSSTTTNGPVIAYSFSGSNTPATVGLSIFPAHYDADPSATLKIVFTDAHGTNFTNLIPVNVLDLDAHRTNAFVVTCNFDRDITGFFSNSLSRYIVNQAANDWTYHFSGMSLDPVAIGSENTYIWSNNFNGGYYFQNTNTWTGYQLYAYGTTNDALRSGSEGSYFSPPQSSNGVPYMIQRSGGFEANIQGNYNTFYWLFNTNDSAWLATDNYGDQTNDFYSIAHHEIGHALIFNEAHAGFATARNNGEFTSDAVQAYYGGPVPIDPSDDHLTGVIDPDSGQGAFGYEYYGIIPRYRWTMTKIDLLCAQEVGYILRSNAAFIDFDFPTTNLSNAILGIAYSNTLNAVGGIPIYDWSVISGTLPPGISLDSFSGTLSGTPTTSGTYSFSIDVQDYHTNGDDLEQSFTLTITASAHLGIAIATNHPVITIYGAAGQHHILQTSTNLLAWTPLTTNTLITNQFQFTDTNALTNARYYRSMYY